MICAKEFVWWNGSQLLPGTWEVVTNAIVMCTVVEKVMDRLVQEATWTGMGFWGEIWSVMDGVVRSERVSDHEAHSGIGGVMSDEDILF